ALLGEALNPVTVLDRLCVQCSGSDVNHIVPKHACTLENGPRVCADAVHCRAAVDLPVDLHDYFNQILRVTVWRDVFREDDLFHAPDLLARKPDFGSLAQAVDVGEIRADNRLAAEERNVSTDRKDSQDQNGDCSQNEESDSQFNKTALLLLRHDSSGGAISNRLFANALANLRLTAIQEFHDIRIIGCPKRLV